MTIFPFIHGMRLFKTTEPPVGLEPRKNKEQKLTHFEGQKIPLD